MVTESCQLSFNFVWENKNRVLSKINYKINVDISSDHMLLEELDKKIYKFILKSELHNVIETLQANNISCNNNKKKNRCRTF